MKRQERERFEEEARGVRSRLVEVLATAESARHALEGVRAITPKEGKPGRVECSGVILSLEQNIEAGGIDPTLIHALRGARKRWSRE